MASVSHGRGAIVEYREKNGAFLSADELLNVSGIGDSVLEANRTNILVSNPKPCALRARADLQQARPDQPADPVGPRQFAGRGCGCHSAIGFRCAAHDHAKMRIRTGV